VLNRPLDSQKRENCVSRKKCIYFMLLVDCVVNFKLLSNWDEYETKHFA